VIYKELAAKFDLSVDGMNVPVVTDTTAVVVTPRAVARKARTASPLAAKLRRK